MAGYTFEIVDRFREERKLLIGQSITAEVKIKKNGEPVTGLPDGMTIRQIEGTGCTREWDIQSDFPFTAPTFAWLGLADKGFQPPLAVNTLPSFAIDPNAVLIKFQILSYTGKVLQSHQAEWQVVTPEVVANVTMGADEIVIGPRSNSPDLFLHGAFATGGESMAVEASVIVPDEMAQPNSNVDVWSYFGSSSGRFDLVQTVIPNRRKNTLSPFDSRGTTDTSDDKPLNGTQALDGFWPYKQDQSQWTGLNVKYDKIGWSFVQTYWPIPFSSPKSFITDSPAVPLSDLDTRHDIDDQFNTMVVYRAPEEQPWSPAPGSRAYWIRSIPVSLASFNWKLRATATRSAPSTWNLGSDGQLRREDLVLETKVPVWNYHLCPFVIQNLVPKGINYR